MEFREMGSQRRIHNVNSAMSRGEMLNLKGTKPETYVPQREMDIHWSQHSIEKIA